MDNLNDIKKIWMSADTSTLPASGEIVKTIKSYRLKELFKGAAMIFFLVILLAVLTWLIFVYHSAMLTTRLGEACYFIDIFLLVYVNAINLKRATAIKNYTNNEFLQHLKEEKRRQILFYNRTQVIGYIIVAAGLLLYVYESVHRHFVWMISAYAFLILFLLAGWLFVRPRAMKKRSDQLNNAIRKAESLSEQLNK